MTVRSYVGVVIGICCLVIPAMAYQWPLSVRSSEVSGEKVAEVMLGNTPYFTFIDSVGNKTARQRADALVHTIHRLDAEDITVEELSVSAKDPRIVWYRDLEVVAITKSEALLHAGSVDEGVRQWIGKLSDLLASKGVPTRVEPKRVRSPKLPHYQTVGIMPDSKRRSGRYYIVYDGYPLNKKIRIVNPENRWSIVARVVSRRRTDPSGVVINQSLATAIGVSGTAPRLLFERVR